MPTDYLKKVIFSVIALTNIIIIVTQLQHLGAILYYLALCLSCVSFVLSIALNNCNTPLYKIVICVDLAIIIIAVCYLIAYNNGWISIIMDRDLLRSYIASAGACGIIVLFLLTILEVVVLPIPAAVTIVIGTYLFGAHISFVVSAIGTIVGSIICFYLGRVFGKKLVNWIVGAETVEKYSKLIEEKGKIPFIVMMLFPFFPDDILCMVVGLTNMKFSFFLTTVVLTRPVMVAFYAYFGLGEIIPFSGWGIPVWIALIALAVGILYLINYFLKRKKN